MKDTVKYFGLIGDSNPIEHTGGVVYDMGSGPVLRYFQPWSDSGENRVSVYLIPIERSVLNDLNWVDWEDVASFCGLEKGELKQNANSSKVLARAQVYEAVGSYYGFSELDPTPQEMTLEEAEARFGNEINAAHKVFRRRAS